MAEEVSRVIHLYQFLGYFCKLLGICIEIIILAEHIILNCGLYHDVRSLTIFMLYGPIMTGPHKINEISRLAEPRHMW